MRALRSELKELLAEYRFDDMRHKLESVFDAEVNGGGNDAETRISIHLNLSEVGLLSRDWLSALQHLAFALSIRSGMLRRPALHSTIAFTARMATRSLQANDMYKAFACMRSLLEIANRCFAEPSVVCDALDNLVDILHEYGPLKNCELSSTFLHARRMVYSKNDGSELKNLEALAETEVRVSKPGDKSEMRHTVTSLITVLLMRLRSAFARFRTGDEETCRKKMIQLQDAFLSDAKLDDMSEDVLRYSDTRLLLQIMRQAGRDLLEGKSIRKPGIQDVFSIAANGSGEEILRFNTDFVDILLQAAGYKTTTFDDFLGIAKLHADAPELSSTRPESLGPSDDPS
ncbi:uncharacterized protein EI97DRAFT_461502 [Westerdykella ornata]|uniref:Uncharacterized protein n=1 Tax=Westerdykella ornata TaxID=318751 RepID=A0A6A6J8J0_WESOR|nr:uncharacterized protein EI97DRAFT_461502 [Westerdykella ornata]KAF2272881.1 hypothetical protein EI97DRAFT_461502 [Westerdykella ornata]